MLTGVALSARTLRNAMIRYILAIAVTLALLLACRSLNPFISDSVTYIVFIPVVAFVAWYCGIGPSPGAGLEKSGGRIHTAMREDHERRRLAPEEGLTGAIRTGETASGVCCEGQTIRHGAHRRGV